MKISGVNIDTSGVYDARIKDGILKALTVGVSAEPTFPKCYPV